MSSPLARFTSVLCGVLLLGISALSQAANYQDWWNNIDLSGMGLNIVQQGQNIGGTWFMYDEDGNPSFLLFDGDLDENQSLTAELHRYYGPEPPAYDETLWHGEVVGTVKIAFSSLTAGTFSYQYDGKTGSFPIDRYSFRTIDLSGTYYSRDVVHSGANCGNAGKWSTNSTWVVTHSGTSLNITVTEESGEVFQAPLTVMQNGTVFTAYGSYSGDGASGYFSISNARLIDDFLTFDYVSISDNSGCREEVKVAAVRWSN